MVEVLDTLRRRIPEQLVLRAREAALAQARVGSFSWPHHLIKGGGANPSDPSVPESGLDPAVPSVAS